MDEILLEPILRLFVKQSNPIYEPLLEDILSASKTVRIYFTAAFGAAALQLFALNKGGETAQPFLRKHFPGKADGFYVWADLVIVIFLGALIGMLFFGPETARQAFGAGFGWVGALTAMTTQTHNGAEQDQSAEEPGDD